MIRDFNRKSFYWGIPGLVTQYVGIAVAIDKDSQIVLHPLFWIGTGLLMTGLAYYAKSRRRHPAWCILGFFGIFGLIALAFLKDKDLTKSED
jgi:hypothetical protein